MDLGDTVSILKRSAPHLCRSYCPLPLLLFKGIFLIKTKTSSSFTLQAPNTADQQICQVLISERCLINWEVCKWPMINYIHIYIEEVKWNKTPPNQFPINSQIKNTAANMERKKHLWYQQRYQEPLLVICRVENE